MDKKDSKKFTKIGRQSKKIKDQLTFKRKMKKMLSCDSVDKMMMDETEIMDIDYMNEACDIEDFDPTNGDITDDGNKNNKNDQKIKKKKVRTVEKDVLLKNTINKNIKAKDTLKEENEMLNIISGIILSKSKQKKKPIEPPNNPKLDGKKSKRVDSVFDPNKSLAQKIIDKIKQKEPTKTSLIMSPVIVKKTSGFPMKKNVLIEMDELIRPKRKLSKKLDYKYSVLEVFNHCKPDAKAEIFSILPQEPIRTSNGKKSQSCKAPVEETVKSSDKINTTLDSLTDITDITDESITKEVETPKPKLPVKPKMYSLFVLADCCVVILKRATKLYFCGKLKASLIYGSAEVLGHKLTQVPQEIYSLPNYSLLCFESSEGAITAPRVSQLTNVGVPLSKTQEILEATCEGDSIILLQPHSNPMTDFMSKHFSSDYNTDLFKRAKLDENINNPEAFKLLQCHFSTESRKGLYAKHFLSENISDLILKGKKLTPSKRNSTILCGGKNAGKSTMLRYLVNKTIVAGPVLVIDLDPGQPEFTISGLISATLVTEPLLGPNFTHLKQPDRSLCLGMINVAENEKRYIRCVQDLFKYCHENPNYTAVPWFINTMGFIGLLGLKLLTTIININKPTILVELKSCVTRNNYDIQLSSENINHYQNTCNVDREVTLQNQDYSYYGLDPYQEEWNSSKPSIYRDMEPKVERLLNALAYFSPIAVGKSLSILEMVPYVISLDDIGLSFNNICVDYSGALSVLNGRMVALCRDERFNTPDQPKDIISEIGLAYCYGYGFVRGIDLVERKVYIISPVSARDISNVNTLVYGECNPNCTSMLVSGLPQDTVVPYATPNLNTAQHAYLMKSPKRNFNPFRLLNMKNNT